MPLARKRRAPLADEASDVEVGPSQRRRQSLASDDNDFLQAAADATQGDSNINQMVKNLVRLCLACEYSRTPIRRTEINAKVLGAQTRQFKTVFSEAQLQLRAVFGMEMTELPLKEKVTLAQRRAAQKSSSTQKTSSSWALTSILPTRYRVAEILPPPQVPTVEAESQYVAIYTFVVALILLSGGTLPDSKLDRYLKRASVEETTALANTAAYSGIDKTEKLLKRMEKDGYVVKIRDTSSGEETIDWIIGQRAKVEVGDRGVKGLVRVVYGELDEEEAIELERKLERSLGAAERKVQSVQQEPQGEKKRGRPKRTTEAEEEEDEAEESEDE